MRTHRTLLAASLAHALTQMLAGLKREVTIPPAASRQPEDYPLEHDCQPQQACRHDDWRRRNNGKRR